MEREYSFQATILTQEGVEILFEIFQLGIFVVDEDFERCAIGCGHRFPERDGFAVVELDRGEIGFVAEERGFHAVMQTIDHLADPASELFPQVVGLGGAANGERSSRLIVGQVVLEDFGEGLGGDAIGIVAIRQEPTRGAAPAQAVDLVPSVELGLLQERLPIVVGGGL